MRITSSAFGEGATIPKKHTCEGPDVSPPLSFEDVPAQAKQLALICDDPDAPAGTWVHWVIWGIPPAARALPEGVAAEERVEKLGFALQGRNDFRRIGYGGPCPPKGHGPHRYFFKLYALDAAPAVKAGATKAELEAAMRGHVVAEAQLVGRYERK
jgi:hypothetical protein